ncbi:MAG: hypothetical protein AAGA66_19410 [Bacteroidota bacterium]
MKRKIYLLLVLISGICIKWDQEAFQIGLSAGLVSYAQFGDYDIIGDPIGDPIDDPIIEACFNGVICYSNEWKNDDGCEVEYWDTNCRCEDGSFHPDVYQFTTQSLNYDNCTCNGHERGNFYVDKDGDRYHGGRRYGCSNEYDLIQTTSGRDCNDLLSHIKGETLLYFDYDSDGFTSGTTYGCPDELPYLITYSLGVDCDDRNESIKGRVLLYKDSDEDGYTDGSPTYRCPSRGYILSSKGEDCDDNDDKTFGERWVYEDKDGDGYTVGATPKWRCHSPGYILSSLGKDCDDTDENLTTNCCPKVNKLEAIDGKSSLRKSRTNLLMVQNARTRSAEIVADIKKPKEGFAPGYPKWQGARGQGTTAIFPGHSSGTVSVISDKGCPAKSIRVTLVDEDKITGTTGPVGEIVKAIKDMEKRVEEKMGTTNLSNTDFKFSVMGSGESKKVDFYANGSKVGKYNRLTASVGGSITLPVLSFNARLGASPFYVKATITPGTASITGNINALYDESLRVPMTGNGTILAKMTGLSIGIGPAAGQEGLCTIAVLATGAIGEIYAKSTITPQPKGLRFTNTWGVSPVVFNVKAYIEVFDNEVCSAEFYSVEVLKGVKDAPINSFDIDLREK